MLTLRHRLILWHGSVFAVGLLGFAFVIWMGAQRILNAEIERWLATQAEGLDRFLHVELKGAGEEAVVEEAREFSTGLPNGSGVQLFNSSDRLLLARPPVAFSTQSSQSPWTIVAGGQRIRLVSHDTRIQGQDYHFVLWRSYQEADATLEKLAALLAGLTPVFLLSSVLGGWWLSRRTLQPVDDLTRAARKVSLSSLSDRLPLPPARDELYRLCVAWNEMLARLDDSALRLNQFTADASHELRTPIAVIRATAELALRHQREPLAYRDALQSIREQSVEMSTLIENMLDLARAEANLIQSSFTRVNLAALLQAARPHFETRARGLSLDFAFMCPHSQAHVLGDEASLSRLLNILLDNALKFTPVPGQVAIRLDIEEDGALLLEISDTGVGISQEALPRIYDRFFQADQSRSSPGTGLGLSLARWIVLSHRASIDVDSTPGKGTCFRVRFPRAPEDPSGAFQEEESTMRRSRA